MSQDKLIDELTTRAVNKLAKCNAASIDSITKNLLTIINNTSDFISYTDENGKIAYINYAGREMCGLSETEDVSQLTIRDLTFKPATFLMSKVIEIVKKMGIWQGEAHLQHRDGHDILTSAVVMQLTTEHPASKKYFSIIARDITKQKYIEEQNEKIHEMQQQLLLEAASKQHAKIERSLLSIINNTSDLIAYADLNTQKIQYMNKAGRKMIGIGKNEDITKLTVPDIVRPTDTQTTMVLAQTLEKYGIWKGEEKLLHRDGQTIICTSSVIMKLTTHYPKEKVYIAVAARDITEQKLTEARNKKIYELQKQKVIKEEKQRQFEKDVLYTLAKVAHETRNPCNAIVGNLQLIQEQTSAFTEHINKKHSPPVPIENFTASMSDMVKDAQHASAHMNSMLEDLMDVIKITTGNMPIKEESCNLKDILENSISMVIRKAQDKCLPIYREFQNVDITINSDAKRLTQIITNLLLNAIIFTEENNNLEEINNHIKLFATAHKESSSQISLHVSVQDTGRGMTAVEIENLFKTFHQTELPSSKTYQEHRRGLQISQGLVSQMGGKLVVKSTPGRGSTFGFKLTIKIANHSQRSQLENHLAKK